MKRAARKNPRFGYAAGGLVEGAVDPYATLLQSAAIDARKSAKDPRVDVEDRTVRATRPMPSPKVPKFKTGYAQGGLVKGYEDGGEFDGEEGQEEDGDHRAAIFADEELVLTKANGVDAGEPGDPAGCGLDLLGRGQEEADGCDEEDGAEGVADPLEAGEEA